MNRLDRTYPGEGRSDDRALVAELLLRDRVLREPITVVGEHFKVKTPVRHARRYRTAEAGPNAPLLKRLVLSPFSLSPGYGRRHVQRQPVPWDVLRRDRRLAVREVFDEALTSAIVGNPLRNVDFRPEGRPVRLGIDCWISAEKGE